MTNDQDDLARVMRAADQGFSRSRLYQWMRQHHDALAKKFAQVRPGWPTLAAEFAALGIMDSTGKPASPERARKTWWRVRRDVKRAQAHNNTAAGMAPAAPVAPTPAAPAAASVSQGPQAPAAPAPAPARKPFDPTEGAFDPLPKFTFKPVRPK